MKTYFIDLDGTMYRGHQNIDGAREFIAYLLKTNQRFIFLTNNASRTGAQNAKHMEMLGFKGIKPEHFFTSSMAAAKHVAGLGEKRRAYYVGSDGLKEALLQNDFQLVKEAADYVFVGLDKEANYTTYSEALAVLLKGAQLVATNNDRRLAHGDVFQVGNGAIVNMLEYASEQTSMKIGKPYAPIVDEALNYVNCRKEEVLLIGDNLETDILLGINHGIETIFVTSGVHQFEDVERMEIYPTYKIHNLKELIKE